MSSAYYREEFKLQSTVLLRCVPLSHHHKVKTSQVEGSWIKDELWCPLGGQGFCTWSLGEEVGYSSVHRSHISGQTLVSSQGHGIVHVEEIKVCLFFFCFALFSMTLLVRVRAKEPVNFGCGKTKRRQESYSCCGKSHRLVLAWRGNK